MRVIFATLATALSVVSAFTSTDLEATTDKITVQYMGASGGMKVFDNQNSTRWIMVQQDKLEEVSSLSGQPNRLNMAGGDAAWTSLAKTTVLNVDTYTTTFTKTMGSAAFSLTAHISTGEVDVMEAVPCSGCDTGSGYCNKTNIVQTVVNGTTTNATQVACQEDSSSATCANSFSKCEEKVTLPKDELKFSIQVHNWPFKSSASTLKYAVILKQKNEGGAVNQSGTTTRRLEIADGGFVTLPTKGKIVGGDNVTDIDVGITTETQGGKFIINFDFPYFPPGTTLYYDPNLGIDTSDSTSDGGGGGGGGSAGSESGSGTVALIMGVAAGCVVLAILVMGFVGKKDEESAPVQI